MQAIPDTNMVTILKKIHKELEQINCRPKLHVMDIQCSKAVNTYVKSGKVVIQIVKLYKHRVNAAEPAVKNAKYYMTACFAIVNVNCLLQLWDKFWTQVQDFLNMM